MKKQSAARSRTRVAASSLKKKRQRALKTSRRRETPRPSGKLPRAVTKARVHETDGWLDCAARGVARFCGGNLMPGQPGACAVLRKGVSLLKATPSLKPPPGPDALDAVCARVSNRGGGLQLQLSWRVVRSWWCVSKCTTPLARWRADGNKAARHALERDEDTLGFDEMIMPAGEPGCRSLMVQRSIRTRAGEPKKGMLNSLTEGTLRSIATTGGILSILGLGVLGRLVGSRRASARTARAAASRRCLHRESFALYYGPRSPRFFDPEARGIKNRHTCEHRPQT